MTQATHPANAATGWIGFLHDLVAALTGEIEGTEPGTWAQRTVRSGFVVALAIREDGKRVLRIGHPDRPRSPQVAEAFNYDVFLLRQHMGVTHWQTVSPSVAGEATVTWLVELEERAK